jgi:transposase
MPDYRKCGRRYDAEFKDNAVALVQSGRTVREVAHDLGVSGWTLRCWIAARRQAHALSEPKTLTAETPEQRELRRLRQENDYLRQQRDILKKALAIVSDGPLNGASNSCTS